MLTKSNTPKGLLENNEEGIPEFYTPKVITINEFSEYTASHFAMLFNSILNSPQPYILLSINSPGGSVFELNQIRDLVINSPKPVIGFGGGMVFSAASLLLSSCTKGHRWMSPSSKLMIHEVATASEGKSSDIISDALETQKLNEELMDILAQNAGKPKSFFKNLIKKKNNADFFLSAQQCKDYNLIDHIGIPQLTMDVKVDWKMENIVKPSKIARVKKSPSVKKIVSS
jgi:ATP-dependent Clp endopeptidase proteolytic subunit ClpP